MLEHRKPYVEKIHSIDAELAGHVLHINLTWNCRCCVGVAFFVSCAHSCQALQLRSELTNNTAKTKMGYISLPSVLNARVGITSYYCVILKMVILHDGIKPFRMGFLCFLKKRTWSCFFVKKKRKKRFFFKNKQPLCIDSNRWQDSKRRRRTIPAQTFSPARTGCWCRGSDCFILTSRPA